MEPIEGLQEPQTNSGEAKKAFLLELMKQLDSQKTILISEIIKCLSQENNPTIYSKLTEKAVNDSFRDLTKFIVGKVREKLNSIEKTIPPLKDVVFSKSLPESSLTDNELSELQVVVRRLHKELKTQHGALKEANITISNQSEELERLREASKEEKVAQFKDKSPALEEARLTITKQSEELERLQKISKEFDETQLWLAQILGEDKEGNLKNQVRDLVKTIINSSKRLSKYKSQTQQASHDLEAYQRMFTIVDLLSEEDSTVRALRILSETEKMSIKELADSTGQNSLVLKMKLRRFARSGAIKLDDEGNVWFALNSGKYTNEQ